MNLPQQPSVLVYLCIKLTLLIINLLNFTMCYFILGHSMLQVRNLTKEEEEICISNIILCITVFQFRVWWKFMERKGVVQITCNLKISFLIHSLFGILGRLTPLFVAVLNKVHENSTLHFLIKQVYAIFSYSAFYFFVCVCVYGT